MMHEVLGTLFKPVSRLILVASMGLVSVPKLSLAATLLSIHSDLDKIIVSLSPEEMAAIKLKVEYPLEIQTAKETFFTHGTPRNLNPLRKTVVIDLLEPDERMKPKQKIRFLPRIHNAILSPGIQSPSQYYQYQNPLAAAGIGGVYDSLKVTSVDRFVSTKATGFVTSFVGFFTFSPGFIDGSLGFYGSDTQIKKTDTPVDANLPIVTGKDRFESTRLEPGIIWIIDDTYSLGARYDWTALKSRQDNGLQSLTYNYTFAEPVISLTSRSEGHEKTLRYKGQDSSQGALANRSVKATQVKQETTTLPASLEISYRYLAPQRFAWGLSLGYLINPPQKASDTGQSKTQAKPAEKIFWQSVLEHRLDQGDRLEYVLAYRGSESRGLSRITQGTNTIRAGLHVTRPYGDGWSFGLGAYGEAGSLSTSSQSSPSAAPPTASTTASTAAATLANTDKSSSFAALVLISIQKEFATERRRRTARSL